MGNVVKNTNLVVDALIAEGQLAAMGIDDNPPEPDYDVNDGWEHETEPCPDCKSYNLYTIPRANGPDDFVKQTECRNCGSTWED